MSRHFNIQMLIAKGKTLISASKRLCDISRALQDASKALVQTATVKAMDGGIVLPKKPPKRAA